jgi:hypothetical protein
VSAGHLVGCLFQVTLRGPGCQQPSGPQQEEVEVDTLGPLQPHTGPGGPWSSRVPVSTVVTPQVPVALCVEDGDRFLCLGEKPS